MTQKIGANKAFYILFAVSILFLYLVFSLLTKAAPLAVSHALYSCKEMITGLSVALPHFFPPIFAVVLFLVIFIGLLKFSFQFFKTKVFVDRILQNKVTAPKKISQIASELSLSKRLIVVDDNSYSSFCYGLIFPKIALSLKTVHSLTKSELKAVLIHESYHLKNRDPLKILLSQVATTAFFFVPILKDFHNHYSLSKELNADQLVVNNKLINDLKSALAKALSPNPSLSSVALFVSEDNLAKRIEILTSPKLEHDFKISFVNIIISLLVLGLGFVALDLPVHAMENGDGTHSYFVLSSTDSHLKTCSLESDEKVPFSSQNFFTPANYSINH